MGRWEGEEENGMRVRRENGMGRWEDEEGKWNGKGGRGELVCDVVCLHTGWVQPLTQMVLSAWIFRKP